MDIAIYQLEKENGLEELIKASNSIALCSDATISDPFALTSVAKAYFLASAENKDQVDLMYLKTVLVSTGWNKNDDVFDPLEMWSSKSTPEDKPFNYEHHQDDIIGHITGCYAVDKSGNMLNEDIVVDQIPKEFDIVTSAVIYKIWEDPEKQSRMDTIVAEIQAGKWFVSMEALFQGFDYALEGSKGIQIISRNEQTAFLTKHLRAYGGTGKFEDAKIGRVLRRIVFSGKGLVRKPANPDSVILNTAAASIDEILNKEIQMPSDNEIGAELIAANEKTISLSLELKKAQDELSQARAEQKLFKRVGVIVDKLEMAKEEAESFAAALDQVSDNNFDIVIAFTCEYMTKKLSMYKSSADSWSDIRATLDSFIQGYNQVKVEKPVDENPAEEEQEPEKKKLAPKIASKNSGKKISVPYKKSTSEDEVAFVEDAEVKPEVEDTSVLEGAELNEEPALADSAAHQEVNKVAAQIAAFFGTSEEDNEK